MGAVDMISLRYFGEPKGVRILGWAWDNTAKTTYARILVVDEQGTIRGGGDGGLARPDVPGGTGGVVTSQSSGYRADALASTGQLTLYAVSSDGAACRIGAISAG
jgi:hypothetical protein